MQQIYPKSDRLLDLFSVETYISQGNPTAAVETVLKIIAVVESLSRFADMGRPGRVSGR